MRLEFVKWEEDVMSCLICERIQMIKEGKNPYFVCELETGYVVLGDHQRFKGYTLFLCKKHSSELHLLESSFKMKYLEEMALVAEAVFNVYKPNKMNYELLGNGDSHIHWHLFPRYDGDLGDYGNNGRGPVWWLPKEEMWSNEYKINNDELVFKTAELKKEIERLMNA